MLEYSNAEQRKEDLLDQGKLWGVLSVSAIAMTLSASHLLEYNQKDANGAYRSGNLSGHLINQVRLGENFVGKKTQVAHYGSELSVRIISQGEISKDRIGYYHLNLEVEAKILSNDKYEDPMPYQYSATISSDPQSPLIIHVRENENLGQMDAFAIFVKAGEKIGLGYAYNQAINDTNQ